MRCSSGKNGGALLAKHDLQSRRHRLKRYEDYKQMVAEDEA